MYKVMVADDEPIMRKALASLINWDDIECEVIHMASNGQEVLKHLEYMKPNILILDISMPGADGIQISKYIWENKLPIQVILLTAYADFSYAQSAIKYNVVDYVTKTGAFDGLIAAIEKAKERLVKEKKSISQNSEILRENYFKAVIDGSLFDKDELEEKATSLSLEYKKGYIAIVFHFSNEADFESKQRKVIHKNLFKFLHMFFGNEVIHEIAIRWDLFVVFLKEEEDSFQEKISEKCKAIIDMMNSFMSIKVYAGVSRRSKSVEEFKKAYDEAENALSNVFLDDKSKIYFYKELKERKNIYTKDIDKRVEEICYQIRKGEVEKSIKLFNELLEDQKRINESADIIKNYGIFIISRCQKILSDFDKNLYDLVNNYWNISNKIYSCIHVNQYEVIIKNIIEKTAKYVNKVSSKKNFIICECEKYIDENFEKYITVSDIARNIGVTPSYLSRVFRDITGDTVISSINKKKLEKAKEHLKNTDMKIYEVADALGFENMTYFSHFFKKYTGVSPKDYTSRK